MRLAHCSDLHLLSLDGARVLDFANKRWIGGLNLIMNRGRHHQSEIFEAMIEDLNAQQVDHILVTGDVTNLALDEEFRFARSLFDRLDLGPRDITVLPGNHDAYVQKGAEYFSEHFADFFRSDPEFAELFDEPWPSVRRRGPVTLISLSTSLQTPWFTAYGVIGSEQLERLGKVLADERLAGSLRLVAIHHSPAEPRAASRIRGLRDRNALYELLQEYGAELILHGHEHLDLSATLAGPAGPIPVRGIQSGTYDSGEASHRRRARYRIYEISDTYKEPGRPDLAGENLRLWDPDSRTFVEDNSSRPESAQAARA